MSHPNSPWHFSASPRPGMWAKAVRFFSSLSTLRVRPLLFVLAGIFLFLLASYAVSSDVSSCVHDAGSFMIRWIAASVAFGAGAWWGARPR
jgi:hypothetical protein